MILRATLVLTLCSSALAATATIPADRDASLIEEPNGALASGAGGELFAGRTDLPVNGLRRAVLRFDLTPEARVASLAPVAFQGVAVALTVTRSPEATPREFRLHRLLADWGEGTSISGGGNGVPSTPGDATWVHAFYPDGFWMHNGAQFDGEPSARLLVAGPGVYRFEGEGLLRDIALWLREPDRNFGWILIGDETQRRTARAFASREFFAPDLRPMLEIRYRTSDGPTVRPAPLSLQTVPGVRR